MKLPPQPKFLIVSLRYIGDVLLATPLALSIKTHLPDARVDFLVFKGTEGVLAKNRHVDAVHTVSQGHAGWLTFLKVFRRYHFALGVNPSDRTAIYASAAGRRSIGFSYFQPQDWWKKKVLSDCRNYDHDKHIVPLMLTQLDPLGIPAIPRVTMAFDGEDETFVRARAGTNYVLLHPYTRQNYKYWPPLCWARLAEMIRAAGARPLFTRTGFAADEAQLNSIRQAAREPVDAFPEPFTLTQFAAAIQQSRGFVGVDTVGTHIAAALGTKVIALFGPTLVHNWGPWPNDWPTGNPYQRKGHTQTHGSITVLQQNWPCVPCGQETCHISQRNVIECLAGLTPELVFTQVERRILANETPPVP
jgi:heptosyltransferase III